MAIELRWTENGFEIVCALLAPETTEPSDALWVQEEVRHWLDLQLGEFERLASRWPGQSFLATLTRAGNRMLYIDLLPTSASETWVASVRSVTTLDRPDFAVTLGNPLASASIRFAILGIVGGEGLLVSDVGGAIMVDWLPRRFTAFEARLFRVLLHRPREAVARQQLWSLISDRPLGENALSTHVGRVRAKLAPHAGVLVTLAGFGYRLDIGPRAEQLTSDPLRVDPAARQVWVGEIEVDLSRVELDMLLMLVRHSGETVLSDELCHAGGSRGISLQMLRSRMVSLRRKLREAGSMIKTVRDLGYRFDPGRGGEDDQGPMG